MLLIIFPFWSFFAANGNVVLSVTMETEAFLVLSYENQHAKWLAGYKHKEENNLTKLPVRTKENYQEHYFVGKHTVANAGQDSCAGWSSEGMERYIVVLKAIMKANKKKKDDIEAFEKVLLESIRADNGITADNALAEKRLKKRKNPAPEDAGPVVDTWNIELSDDSDDDSMKAPEQDQEEEEEEGGGNA